MAANPTLLWFRQDLRLQDNPALAAALARTAPIIPVYIFDEVSEGRWAPGGASLWWLHHALASLDASLRERGSRLILARGDSQTVLREFCAAHGVGAVYWNRRYEPAAIACEKLIESEFAAAGVETQSFNSALLHEPHSIANRQGRPFQVFTPYWRTCFELPVEAPKKFTARVLPAPTEWPRSLEVEALNLLPEINWDGGFQKFWEPGEAGAAKRLKKFVAHAMENYASDRDRPDIDGTSKLSPWLHFGEIGPRQVWAAVKAASHDTGVFPPNKGARIFLNEIGWREFAYHLLFHFPRTTEHPLREEFERFPWAKDADGDRLRAWQIGATGYPIVDAGMRQLWQSGWMHNRVRMIVASFLVKHLRLPWTRGARWFWDTLVDADLANNTLGWQMSGGCGADAAPYFRIFAPVRQGEKFDPKGEYVRRWVPELAKLPAKNIHAPWQAPMPVLAMAGVKLGGNYPHPIVDHASARAEALDAFKSLRRQHVAAE